MIIINCTQHVATPDLKAAGVVDFPQPARSELIRLLTFEELPTINVIHERAKNICALVENTFKDTTPKILLLGGAPFLMATLERYIIFRGWKPVYAFSKRESVEEMDTNGTVKKISFFKFSGFVEV